MSRLIGNKFSSTVTNLTKTFTGSGTLTTTPYTSSAQYLVVGGGGAGGGGTLHYGVGHWVFGGGGGAGGFRTNVPGATSGRGASAEPSLPVSAATSYPIVVGAGGAAGGSDTYTLGHNGHGSSFGPDPDANTSLLVKSDTTDGSTTFTDSSSNAHSITVAGNTQHKTDQQRIGNSSMYFDGTGDYLEIADHTSLDLDGGDFTIECWFRCDDVDSPNLQSVLAKWNPDSICSYYLLIHPTAKLRWYVGNGSSSFSYVGNFDIVDKTWYHAALTKDGDVFTAYVDGTQDGSTLTFSTFADNNLTFRIGTDYGNARPYKGYVDEVRISKGVERYTGNFDPTRADYITALGGGGSTSASQAPAAPYSQPDPSGYLTRGQHGGCGGGGGFYNNPSPAPGARKGDGTTGQGYDGGVGSGGANVGDGGGGGGGAGAVGANYSVAHGGAGQSSSISGSAVTYAGGGGGARSCHPQVGTTAAGDGGSGGGGNGGKGQDGPQPPAIPGSNQPSCRTAGAGTVNTGGGGGGNGGARYDGVHASVNDKAAPGALDANAKAGGSGVVIIKEVVPGSITTYDGSVWNAGGIWNAKDVYKERVKDNWK